MISAFGRPAALYSRSLCTLAVSLALAVCARAVVVNDAIVSDAASGPATAALLDASASGGTRTLVTGNNVGGGVTIDTPTLVTVAPNGTIYYYETLSTQAVNCVVSVNPATGTRAIVSGAGVGTGPGFAALSGMAWDLATSSLVVSDSGSTAGNAGILNVDPVTGNRTQITGNGVGGTSVAVNNPQFVAVGSTGTIYYYDTGATEVVAVNPVSGVRTLVSGGSGNLGTGGSFQEVTGMAWDLTTSTLVVSDAGSDSTNSGVMRIVPANGNRSYVTGGGMGMGTALDIPESVTVTPSGAIYYIEEDAVGAANSIVSVNPANGSRSILSGAGVGTGTAFVAPTWLAAAALAPVITNSTLTASGTVGLAFVTYTITGSNSPSGFTASGLPSGLSVNSANGQITGIPTQAGTFNVTIGASNLVGPGVNTLVITISPAMLVLSPLSLPSSTFGSSYLQTLAAGGGTPPYSFSITSGMPVPGLMLSSGGVLSGSLTQAGSYTFTVTATDSSVGAGAPFTGSQSYTVGVAQAAQTITFTPIVNITEAVPYTLVATSTSGLPVSFTVQSGDATITGTSLKILNLLPVTIAANQSGNGNYLAAPAVTQTVTAGRAGTRVALPTNGGNAGAAQTSLGAGTTSLAITPGAQTVSAGSSPTLSVSSSGAIQWKFNGTNLVGATGPTLTLSNIGTAQGGTYTAMVTNADGSVTAGTATVTVTADARLMDVSIRALVGADDDQSLFTGFVLAGSGPELLLVRGIGPTLAQFQVAGPLASPQLSLVDAAGNLIASNTGWGNAPALGSSPLSASVQPATSGQFAQLDVFGLPAGSSDSALVATLTAGQYTAKVSGVSQTTGVAMTELTDAGASASRVSNVSGRAQVGTGSSVLVAGFVSSGTTSQTLVIRGVGPALASSGVTGTLGAPQLTLYDSSGNVVATNVGWSNAIVPGNSSVAAGVQPATASVMAGVNAFALPAGSPDCAMVVTLPPGAYTAQVSGVNSTTGIGLVEIYDVPAAP